VSEPGTVGSGIQLATVLGFLDIAVDALAGAREEIDALNVCTGCIKAGKVTR